MRIKALLMVLGAMALGTFAIAPQAAAQNETATLSRRNGDIRVTVRNNNWLDVRVYAVTPTNAIRLGTVSGLGQETFILPRSLNVGHDIQLAVRPIGQRGVFYSMPVLASPGDTIEFRVENHLALSYAIVN